MTAEQAFEILGIYDRDIDEVMLKRAFYEAARYTHPDSNPEDEHAKAKFHLINEAYDVLLEYLKNKSSTAGETTNAKKATQERQPDAWDSYCEADRKYEQERHQQARQKAEEAIKRQNEKEQKERQAKGFSERQPRIKSPWWQEDVKEIRAWAITFWENKKAFWTVVAALLFGIAITCFPLHYSVAHFASIMGEAAKWIVIVWVSFSVAKCAHENWNNRILSIFVFLVTMELAIWGMSWLVNHVVLSYN